MSAEEAPAVNPNPCTSGSKRRRNLPGTPDPEAEVVALSPRTLIAESTFTCEVCGREFCREQNLQIHRRGHNLPWRFAAKSSKPAAKKRVYVCPEKTCAHHDPSRALGDLTGVKKHYSRKHGEKKWKCERCSKRYAVRADWTAHARVCGSREFECCCGALFSRKESYVMHRATCASAAEGDDVGEVACTGIRASTVNKELLFPSLWGQSSSATEAGDGEEEHRRG